MPINTLLGSAESRRPPRRASAWDDLAVEEAADERRHLVQLVLQREMAGVEQVQVGVRKVAPEGMRTRCREDRVVGAPDDQRRRTPLAEIRLHRRIEQQVGAIIVEEIELVVGIAGTVEQ